MINALSHVFVYVTDQDEALDFYVGKLGLEVNTDADMGDWRWLTVNLPGHPELEIVLMVPGPPAHDADTQEQIRAALSKGGLSFGILTTDDCRATYEDLRAKGVEFTQEPTERFYGIDCGLRDPFGNAIRITQPAPVRS
jgi:catechol 2,3-dioxygenase-like lactoylglutathione lyase family enzyme